jgi:hypothetical protein
MDKGKFAFPIFLKRKKSKIQDLCLFDYGELWCAFI